MSLKSAEEWLECQSTSCNGARLIRMVQQDTYRHAAELCEKERIEAEPYDHEDASHNAACMMCKSAIEQRIKELEGR